MKLWEDDAWIDSVSNEILEFSSFSYELNKILEEIYNIAKNKNIYIVNRNQFKKEKK